jgi:hypothetical protein
MPGIRPVIQAHRLKESGATGIGFLPPFGHRHWLLGPSCSRPRDRPSSRSAHRICRPGPGRGSHVPHAQDPAGVGAATYPGAAVFLRPVRCSRPPPAASHRPALHPGPASIHPRLTLTRRIGGSLTFTRPAFPSPTPPDGSEVASASTPGLRTPPLPATHAQVGTGHRTLTRATSSTTPPTSNSTRHLHMRPRVAPPTECLSTRRILTFDKPRIPRQTGTSVRYAPYSPSAT